MLTDIITLFMWRNIMKKSTALVELEVVELYSFTPLTANAYHMKEPFNRRYINAIEIQTTPLLAFWQCQSKAWVSEEDDVIPKCRQTEATAITTTTDLSAVLNTILETVRQIERQRTESGVNDSGLCSRGSFEKRRIDSSDRLLAISDEILLPRTD